MEDPRDWPYSSYHSYGLGHEDPLVDEHGLYQDLGETPKARQLHYQDYVLKERPYESGLDQQFQIAQAVHA